MRQKTLKMGKIIHNGIKEYPKLYRMWYNMRARCKYKSTDSYERYGGRGINVCIEWKTSFAKFKDFALTRGYKDCLIIDRINNDGNYEPSNIRFVDAKTSCLNRSCRKDSVTKITGIRYRKNNNLKSRYSAIVWKDGKDINIGSFPDIESAIQKRKEYINGTK